MAEKTDKSKRPRSPDHPYFSLADCVDFTIKLYASDKQSQVPKDIAISRMGISPKSSTANRVLSSLLSYRLLEDVGVKENKRVWVSELAKRIIVDTRQVSEDREKALRNAALASPIMRKVWEKWMAGLPNVDTIKTLLILDLKFTERAAGRFALIIIKNFNYAKLEGYYETSDTPENNHVADEDNVVDAASEQSKGEHIKLDLPIGKGYKTSTLTLAGNKEVVLHSPTNISQDDFEFIVLWMKQLKLVTDEIEPLLDNDDDTENEMPF